MKHKGSRAEFADRRDKEILEAYRQCIDRATHISHANILARIATMPSSRFWVSAERAAIVVARLEAGKPLPRMRRLKREMYSEIHRRYRQLRPLYPHLSPGRVVEMVVDQPAPKLYMEPGYVNWIIKKRRQSRLRCNSDR